MKRTIRNIVSLEYESPVMTIESVQSEGVLCVSVNGIGDLDYIYDENEKE